MESLPVRVMVHIFSFLEARDKCRAARVCKSWYHLVREKQLWKHVDLTPFRVNLQATWKIIRYYFTDALRTLRLRGFLMSFKKTECISNAVLSSLCERCPSLEELHIEDAFLRDIDSGNLPQTLKVLELNQCAIVPGWFRPAVEKGRFNQLQVLNVAGSSRFCEEDLKDLSLIPHGGKLVNLNLSNCYRVTAKNFETFAEHFPYLKYLNVTGTNICDDDMHFICRHMKVLETLILQDCDSLTDFCIGPLATLLVLSLLDLSGRSMTITRSAIMQLLTKLKKLENVHISSSLGLTDADLEQIGSSSVKCQIHVHNLI